MFKPLTLVVLSLTVALAACKKGEGSGDTAAPTAASPDPRLNEIGSFKGGWPPRADSFEAAVKEVEGNLGPGTRQDDGSLVWAAMKDPEHCARITLKDVGGTLDAQSATLKTVHPDFGACASLAAHQRK